MEFEGDSFIGLTGLARTYVRHAYLSQAALAQHWKLHTFTIWLHLISNLQPHVKSSLFYIIC